LTRITNDSWLGDLMSRGVYRVHADATSVADEVDLHARGQARAFYFAKVPADRVGIMRALTRIGFSVVDVNITFTRRPRVAANRPPGIDIGECTPKAADAVLDIAGHCFKYTRFHLDPLVEVALAHRIKREWVRNYVLKRRGDRLFVAYVDGRPAGFLAALVGDRAGERTATIDLVGVDTTLQGRGIGQSLVLAFADHYRGSCDWLAVGTQVANIPSVRLYEKLGFSLAQSEYVLHKHIPDP
jgi:dTDP-4-amino-4,6-dideoxy-D-galactose acyltransferase